MKLLVLGAHGQLGSRLVEEAVRRGHEVTAGVRDLSRPLPDGVRGVALDATDPDSIADAAAGHDAVLSAVIQRATPEMLPKVARALLIGLERAGVSRLVVTGGSGSLEVAPGLRSMDSEGFNAAFKPEAMAHAEALEVLREADTPVEWSYISPARNLEPGGRTGAYRVGGDRMLLDEDGMSRITMEDFAVAMLDEVENPRHPRTRFSVAY